MGFEIVTGSRPALTATLASDFETAARESIAARGAFTVLLAGGSIAPLFFPTLARLPLDWTHIDFFWADERAVPPNHSESNFGAANRLWIQPAGVPPERVHRMAAEEADIRRACAAYAAELRRSAGDPPVLDFGILGVGPDGHIASLFPGHAALHEEREIVVPMDDAPKPPPRRMTLTLPVLAATRKISVAGGPEKASVVRSAAEPGSPLPLGRLMSRARNLRVLLLE